MAERMGFEPMKGSLLYTLSKRAPSTTKAIKITDVNELGDVMISQLSSLFETKKKFH